jgi:tellurite resistance protein TehA-like permease
MKNQELWECYKDYTRTLTEVARKLGFAAAAICWLFKENDNTFPFPILTGLSFVVMYFTCDILQFLLGAVFIRTWIRSEEKKRWKEQKTIEGDYNKPAWLDYPSYIMWWIKILCLLSSFILIGFHLIHLSMK